MNHVTDSQLGKNTNYHSDYQPALLFPIARSQPRADINVPALLPFVGHDVWNAFEISWLNAKGKPMVAVGEFIFPCTTPNLVESKSFKLYLNSFNNTRFDAITDVINAMEKDLSAAAGGKISLTLTPVALMKPVTTTAFTGVHLDQLDVACDTYTVNAGYLKTAAGLVEESVYSDLLKSNCPVTDQPDWASVCIQYRGKPIDHAGLLQYLVSYRNHNEFHEQCVERIFMDIMRICSPEKLTVEARYTRRGGLDINPVRSTEAAGWAVSRRLVRQ